MDEVWTAVRLLVLLGVANAAPVAAKRVLGARWSTPLDGGLRFVDGRRLLGPAKTVRGVVASVAAAALAAVLLGLPVAVGAAIGAAAMAGDALSSFVKRRLGVVRGALDLSWLQVAAVTAAFFALQMPVAWLAHRLGLHERPY